jgi:PHP family Zn ribbon phosphoesterase
MVQLLLFTMPKHKPMKANDHIASYCFNRSCSNSLYRYQTTAITYLTLEKTLTNEIRCSKCGSLLKSKIDLEIEEQLRELLPSAS